LDKEGGAEFFLGNGEELLLIGCQGLHEVLVVGG